ncbi:MAG: two-component system regulatory protein YycI [Tissierellia bacterium]|nr:two-component system regulatory protein YycI [Tissierellia bacterium]
MDWSKSKNLLLIMLAAVNLMLLGTIYFENKKYEDKTKTHVFVEKTQSILNNYGIDLSCEIPTDQDGLNVVEVSFESIEPQKLNHDFFDSKATVVNAGKLITYEYKDETLSVINSKRLLYEKEIEKTGSLDADEAIKMAEEFFESKNISTDDMSLKVIEINNDETILKYHKLYKGRTVETSYTNVYVTNDGVSRLDRLWVNVLSESATKTYINSASKALLSLIGEENRGKIITDIELCYYFDPEEQGYVEDITKTLKGRALPAWRIQFSDGEFLIIDNI